MKGNKKDIRVEIFLEKQMTLYVCNSEVILIVKFKFAKMLFLFHFQSTLSATKLADTTSELAKLASFARASAGGSLALVLQ